MNRKGRLEERIIAAANKNKPVSEVNTMDLYESELGALFEAYQDIDRRIVVTEINNGKYDGLSKEFYAMMGEQTGYDFRSEKRKEDDVKNGILENYGKSGKLIKDEIALLASRISQNIKKNVLLKEKMRIFLDLKSRGIMSEDEILDMLLISWPDRGDSHSAFS